MLLEFLQEQQVQLTIVKNKIPNVSNLAKKNKKKHYNTKINEIEKKIIDHNHGRYVTTPEFNKLKTENFKARLAQASLLTKTDFDIKLQDISKRVTSKKTKLLLLENDLKKLKTFDLSYFRGQNHFEEDVTQLFSISANTKIL